MVVIRDCLWFAAALAGLGLPFLPWLKAWPPLERLALAVGAALLTGGLTGFALYVAGAPLKFFWLAPIAGAAWTGVTARGRAAVAELLREPAVRGTLGRWALLAAVALGWQMTVQLYSGAAWQGDWYEHFDRTHFFLDRWPRDFLFLDTYPLPSRPPLVNLWSAVLLSAAGGAFFHHQVFLTLLSSLVFLPLAVLLARWRSGAAGHWLLLVLLALNPLFLQHATFPWTKLPAAFFVLLAWLQLTPPPTGTAPRGHLLVAALALAAGMLAHYSTGSWIVAFALAWLATRAREFRRPEIRREALLGAGAAALVLFTWVGWSVWEYGTAVTFTQNTAVALAPSHSAAGRLLVGANNLFHTLSPFSLVGMDHPLLAQRSAAGQLRDSWFILFQLKLWWAFGTVGGVVLLWLLARLPGGPGRTFGLITAGAAIVLGAWTHAIPDVLGLTHITLVPLVLFGLAWIAAHALVLPRWLAGAYAVGLLVDFTMGIAVHFAVQAGWIGAGPNPAAPWAEYNRAVFASFQSKVNLGLVFLADRGLAVAGLALAAGATAVALAGFIRAKRAPAPR